jgi:hypothetical protein
MPEAPFFRNENKARNVADVPLTSKVMGNGFTYLSTKGYV